MKKLWQAESNDTFKKQRSRTASRRTHSTYTLRGRDLSVQQTLRKLAKNLKTLGSGNLIRIVEVPSDMIEDCVERLQHSHPDLEGSALITKARTDARNEWIAANTVDFFNEVSLLYGMVEEFHQSVSKQDSYDALVEDRKSEGKKKLPAFSNGFPRGFEYRVKGPQAKAGQTNGASYVNVTMAWLEDQIDNQEVFPEMEDDPFPPEFLTEYIPEMFKRMFRVFAIIYSVCWDIIREYEAEAHINTCFKHFYFFMKRFDLLKKSHDKDVFLKTKVKNIIDLNQLDKEYEKLLEEYEKEEAEKQPKDA